MADWRMSLHVFIVILVVFSFVWKSEGKFTYGPEADKLCQAYKKVCPRGKLCAIQTLKWPQSMTFPVCVFKHDLHVRSRVCSEAPSPGHCGSHLRRWYFNVHMASCSWFTYTGCGGNGNNFVSREACESVCLSDPTLDMDVSGRNTENLYPRHHVRSDVTRDDRAGQQAAREPYRYSSGRTDDSRTDNAVDAAASEDLYSHVSEGGLGSPYQPQTNNEREEHQTRSQPSSYKNYNNDNYDPRLTSSKVDDSRLTASNADDSRLTSTNADGSRMTSNNGDGSRMISSNVGGSILASAGTDDPRWTFRQTSSSADGSRMGDNVDTDVGNTDASPQRYGPGQRYVGPRDKKQLEYRESPVEHSALTAHPASHRNGNNGNGNHHHNASPNSRNGRNHNYNSHNDRHHNNNDHQGRHHNNNHQGRHHSNNNHQGRHHNNRHADPPLWPDKAADDLMELYYEPGQLVRQPEATDDQYERGFQRGSLARHTGRHDTRMPDARMPDTRMPDSRMPEARNDGRYNLNKLLDSVPRQLDVPDNSDRLKDLAYKPDTETRHHQSRKIPPRLPTATIRRRQPSNLQPLRTLSLLTRHQSLNNRRGAMETATLASSYAPVANETTWDFDEPNNNKPRGGKGGAKSRRGKDGKKRRRNRKGRKRDRKLRKKRRQRRRNNKANDNGGADDDEIGLLDGDATADLETGAAMMNGVNEVSETSSNDERGLRAANYTTNSTSNRNKKRKNRKRKNRKRKGRGRRRGKGRKRLQGGGDENTPPSTGELTQSSNGFHLQPLNNGMDNVNGQNSHSGMDNDNGLNNHNGLNSNTGLNSHSAGVSTQGKGGNQYYEQIHLFDLLENTRNDTRPSGK